MEKEHQILDKIISAILGTHDATILHTDAARSRALGTPYDTNRIELFACLLGALNTHPFRKRKQETKSFCNTRSL